MTKKFLVHTAIEGSTGYLDIVNRRGYIDGEFDIGLGLQAYIWRFYRSDATRFTRKEDADAIASQVNGIVIEEES